METAELGIISLSGSGVWLVLRNPYVYTGFHTIFLNYMLDVFRDDLPELSEIAFQTVTNNCPILTVLYC